MSEQTLPDFLFAVITEQRKSISTLVDALNEAKNGISQLTTSAERSEESRRQAETLLEQQSTVESGLKFDLTQARQHIEVLQDAVATLEENLVYTEKLLCGVPSERDATVEGRNILQASCEGHAATVREQSRMIAEQLSEIAELKLQVNRQFENEKRLTERLEETLSAENAMFDAYVRLRCILGASVIPSDIPLDLDHISVYTEKRAYDLVDELNAIYKQPVVAWANILSNSVHLSKVSGMDTPLIAAPTNRSQATPVIEN